MPPYNVVVALPTADRSLAYLETKEHLGGFWIIDAPDEETARRLAAEGSNACRGEVEVRAFEGLG